MLREIGATRQDSARGRRRWFQDDYFDLYIWQDAAATVIAFQLCYARNQNEGVIRWSSEDGFSHERVDDARHAAGMGMAPVLRTGATPPYFRIYNCFLSASEGWDPGLRTLVIERLREYRRHLFGTRRTPRRFNRRPGPRSVPRSVDSIHAAE